MRKGGNEGQEEARESRGRSMTERTQIWREGPSRRFILFLSSSHANLHHNYDVLAVRHMQGQPRHTRLPLWGKKVPKMWAIQCRGNAVPLHTYRRAWGGAECKIGGHSHDHLRMLPLEPHVLGQNELLSLGADNLRRFAVTKGPSTKLLEGFRASTNATRTYLRQSTSMSSSGDLLHSALSETVDDMMSGLHERPVPRGQDQRNGIRGEFLGSPSTHHVSEVSHDMFAPEPFQHDCKATLFPADDDACDPLLNKKIGRSIAQAGAAAVVTSTIYQAVKHHKHKNDRQSAGDGIISQTIKEKCKRAGESGPLTEPTAEFMATDPSRGDEPIEEPTLDTVEAWSTLLRTAPAWSQLRLYSFIRSLGKGSHAEALLVEKGSYERDERKRMCVLKVSRFLPEAINESRLLSVLSAKSNIAHPYVVRLEDVHVEQFGTSHLAFLQLEYCEGGDLDTYMRGRGTYCQHAFDDVHIHYIASELLAGLASLHAQEIVHRDVKPANILLGTDGDVKLCDFGVASRYRDFWPDGSYVPAGSLAYMSPEIRQMLSCASERDQSTYNIATPRELPVLTLTGKVDVWALSCVVYALCLSISEPNLVDVPPLQAVAEVCDHRGWPPFNASQKISSEDPGKIANEICWLLVLGLQPNPGLRPSAEDLKKFVSCSEKQTNIERLARL